MTRRQFAGATGTAATALSSAAVSQTQNPGPPNLVLILSDDHSYPYLGCYGHPDVRTPNLDRFALEGMRFERAFQAAPQCVPSRTALLTGRSPVSARMGRFNSPLPPDVVTLPELLRQQAGYYTGVCRRWFHLDGSGRPGPINADIFRRNGSLTWNKRVDYLDRTGNSEKTGEVVRDFLDKKPSGKPFFLWVNFSDPHHPWDAASGSNAYDPAKISVPKQLPDLPGVRDDLSRYYGEISRMDSEFQAVLDALKDRKALDNTLIVFMGDNGMAFPHGKGSLYDPGIHVPLLARWAGRVAPGSVATDLISGEDITPTFLEAAGLSPVKTMSGRSFLGRLTSRAGWEPRRHVFSARLHHGSAGFTPTTKANTFDLSRSVRSQTHKLIYNCTPHMEYAPVDSANGPGWSEMTHAHRAGQLPPPIDRAYFARPRPVFELYDLAADPAELNNLAGQPQVAEIEKQLKVALQEKMITDYDFLPLPLGEA